ncbi:hypothetical protein PIROE2DRAFT_15744, partial [Piromyces sp. E2]
EPVLDKTKINFIEYPFSTNENIPSDEDYIKNYKGEELGFEWNWIKNISIVYTWVDGSDIEFLDMKSKYDYGYRRITSRFRSADELKYSIRSVEKFMPWFNGTIYIVTCNQIPKWLDTQNKRIKIIDHKDIMPKYVYPTFDSNIIELFLDKIPGISERFIYFNDDVFLNNYIHPCFFFTRKSFYPKIYRNLNILHPNENKIKEYIATNKLSFYCNVYFTYKLIREYFDDKFVYTYIHHAPFVLYRDLYEPYRLLFKEELKSRCAYRFRNHYKIQVLYLYQIFMEYATRHDKFPLKLGGNGKAKYFEGQPLAKEGSINNYSVKIINGETSNKYIIYNSITDDSEKNIHNFEIINHSNSLIFNLNDNYSKNRTLYDLTEFLMKKYPYPSSFENKKYFDLENRVVSRINKIDKFSIDMLSNLPDEYDKLTIENFNKVIKENKYKIINNYVNDKELLSGAKSEISSREKKEIHHLLSYNGTELEEKWKWAKDVSIVYLIENYENYTNYELDLLSLKYSLRSIESYLPWFSGKIFIITPIINIVKDIPWLNLNNSRIKVIHQNDIIEKPIKSIKNKHIVELYLDKIPGITEKFIYLNNYHFFKNYVHPLFFFSNEYYPKYHFGRPLTKMGEEEAKKNDSSFIETYSIIKEYFGEFYVTLRYLRDAPYTLYRDLFEPVRSLYKSYIEKWKMVNSENHENFKILPLYLVSTYNIYGTEHPFFPDYVVGYGKIMKTNPPLLNSNRTINYFGFDIPSQKISKTVMLLGNLYSNNTTKNYGTLYNIKKSNCIFFNINIKDKNNLTIDNIITLFKVLNSLYRKKSTFEN